MISTPARSPRVILLMLALVFFLMFVGECGTAQAAEFTVNSTADSTECAATCTLRGAIAAAEASPDATNTILLPAETFELGAFDEAHPTSTGQLRLNNSAGTTIKIVGGGVGQTTIDAAKHDRVLRVGGGGSVVLEGLTLENGFPEGNEKDNTLEESVRGGGIYQLGGALTLDRVRLTADGNSGYGGGIDVEGDGTLKLVDSELDHDYSTSGGGGGISVESGTLEAIGTTFTSTTRSPVRVARSSCARTPADSSSTTPSPATVSTASATPTRAAARIWKTRPRPSPTSRSPVIMGSVSAVGELTSMPTTAVT